MFILINITIRISSSRSIPLLTRLTLGQNLCLATYALVYAWIFITITISSSSSSSRSIPLLTRLTLGQAKTSAAPQREVWQDKSRSDTWQAHQSPLLTILTSPTWSLENNKNNTITKNKMIELTYKHMAIPTVDRPNRGIFNMILREFQIKLPKPRQCISAIKCLICGYMLNIYRDTNMDMWSKTWTFTFAIFLWQRPGWEEAPSSLKDGTSLLASASSVTSELQCHLKTGPRYQGNLASGCSFKWKLQTSNTSPTDF